MKSVVWFSLQLLSEKFFILRRTERDMIKMCIGLHVKYPLFFSDFNETWIFSADFRKVLKYRVPWKSVQCEPSLSMRTTDGRTDTTNLILAFCNFSKAHRNPSLYFAKSLVSERPAVRKGFAALLWKFFLARAFLWVSKLTEEDFLLLSGLPCGAPRHRQFSVSYL